MGCFWFKYSSVALPYGVAIPPCMAGRLTRAPEHTDHVRMSIAHETVPADAAARDAVQAWLNACGIAGRCAPEDDLGICLWVDDEPFDGVDVTWFSRPLFAPPPLADVPMPDECVDEITDVPRAWER